MALDLKDLKEMHDKSYNFSPETRERAADDLVFYWITQWDDNMLSESQLGYRGEFNVLRKAGKQILADLAANPVQVDFEPINETQEDNGDLLDGMYRTDDNHNQTLDAYEVGRQESVICGMGAWELYAEYESIRTDSQNQVIRRRPIHEANNCLFWDPNAKMLDKSDANYCSLLTAYSEDGYKDLVFELTGEELPDKAISSFKEPEQSYSFPWILSGNKLIYVASFYHREIVPDKILIMADPFDQQLMMREKTLMNVMDEMISSGFRIINEKTIKRYQITKYIASGLDILSQSVISGEYIPIVPVYGEHAFVEGVEHWEGVTKCAKDPARLRDFQLSYLADIVGRSPRKKNIYLPEQIAGHEAMYSETGSENNYPYLLQNRLSGDGTELPFGPVGETPDPTIPPALIASIELSKDAILDVANPGIPQDIADPDLSGKALRILQTRIDMQSMVYQEHMKHAKRRDGQIYASMASEVYDAPRTVKLTLPDGTKKTAKIMEAVIDRETGDVVVLNDLQNSEFEVYSKIGPSYHSQKEQTIERLENLTEKIDQGHPVRLALILKSLLLMDGVDFDDIRKYANRQLLLTGFREPETDEERQLLKQKAAQGEEPTAEMLLAQAELMKGQADMAREKREMLKLQLDAKNELSKRQIDTFEAETDRIETQIDAAKAGADIDYKRVDKFGKQIENAKNLLDFSKMNDDELFRQLEGV